MFDWDRDCEAETARRSLPLVPQPVAQAPERRGPPAPTGTAPWWLGSLAVAIVLALAWQVASAPGPRAPMPVSLAAFGGVPLGATEAALPPLPDLRVYGPRQVAAFQAGLARFPDPDLILFADQTRAAMDDSPESLTPYHLDSLSLTDHEIARRGLLVPGRLP
jgi:hypothetical protein